MMLSLNNEQEKEFRDICPFLLTKFNKNFKHIFLGEEIGYDISLNERMLENTVLSWLYDEKRHMDYHNIDSLRLHKKLAYFTHWFIKIKPIQFHNTKILLPEKVGLVNEVFALYIIFQFFATTPLESVSADFINDMLYNFRYRDSSPESLFPTLYLLQKALDNKIQI
jgi:hypothetical protein